MDQWRLWTLILLSIAGAWLASRVEAREIDRRTRGEINVELNHVFLAMIRMGAALLLILLLSPRPLELWIMVMAGVMMAAVFGVTHRVCLNWTRINKYKHRIPLTRLGTSLYDNLLTFLIPGMQTRFLVLCGLEILITAAMFIQLTD